MPLLLTAALTLAGLARAGMVTAPPPGAAEVGVLLCAGDGCNDRMFWVTHDSGLGDLPVLSVDSLLADEAAARRDEQAALRLREALEQARLALLEGRPQVADNALNEAGRALEQWAGSPTNQELFTLWYLRGAVSLEEGLDRVARQELRRAAAVAWNRSVALPPGTERWAATYYAELEALLAEGTGQLVITEGEMELQYALDGVPLGPAPIRVHLFPGLHRLTADHGRQGHAWTQEVEIVAGRTATTQARTGSEGDARWATYQLVLAVETMKLDPELARVLDAWAERHGVRSLRLLRLDLDHQVELDEIDREVGGTLPTFQLRAARYEPALRRMTPLGD